MDIEEAWGEHQTISIDFLLGCSSELAYGSNLPPGDCDCAAIGWRSRSITDFGVLNQDIVSHDFLLYPACSNC
jgi:hypothetical protein